MATILAAWEEPPDFIQGQTLSAEAHLNTLARDLNALRDIAVGNQNTFVGWAYHNYGFEHEYRGFLRHRASYLEYELEVTSGTGTLTIGVWTVTGCESLGVGSYAGTVAIPEAGFTLGDFYEVAFTGCEGFVWLLREVVSDTPLAALDTAPWVDEHVPSAAEWQALSDRATALQARLASPKALIASFVTADQSPQTAYPNLYPCTINHKIKNLHYRISVHAPYWCSQHDDHPELWAPEQVCGVDANGDPWCDWVDCSSPYHTPCPACSGDHYGYAEIKINGTVVLTLGCGHLDQLEALGLTNLVYGSTTVSEFEDDLDIDALGIALGDDYTFSIDYTSSTAWDWYNRVSVRYIMERSAGTEGVAGWQDLPLWAYGDYVHGPPPPLDVSYFATDLNLLLYAATGENYPARQNWFGGLEYYGYSDDQWRGVTYDDTIEDHRLWTVRQHRYLHYYAPAASDEQNEQEPVLKFRVAGASKDTELQLPLSLGEWRVYDLDKAEGLYSGMLYWLERVEYAIEDSEP